MMLFSYQMDTSWIQALKAAQGPIRIWTGQSIADFCLFYFAIQYDGNCIVFYEDSVVYDSLEEFVFIATEICSGITEDSFRTTLKRSFPPEALFPAEWTLHHTAKSEMHISIIHDELKLLCERRDARLNEVQQISADIGVSITVDGKTWILYAADPPRMVLTDRTEAMEPPMKTWYYHYDDSDEEKEEEDSVHVSVINIQRSIIQLL